jgi:RNA polymerase sigma factor (sigma-70 family)
MGSKVIHSTNRPPASAKLPSAKPPTDSVFRSLEPEDQVLLTKLLSEPTEFVDHPDFSKRGFEKRLFGAPARLVHTQATRFFNPEPIDLRPASKSRVPTLSLEQERTLFLRFNFARWKVSQTLASSAGKRLSLSKTRKLLAWGHRVLDTRTMIVRLNLPLVLAMAKRNRLTNVDYNELISEGNMALLRSVEKFDTSRGFKFSTYSCRAILKSFSRVAMRASRYRGRFPTEFDPAMERSDYLDTKRESVEEDCVDELKEILLKNLAELSEVERTVISERFAIGQPAVGGEHRPKTLEQVGDIIGVTKERVRQIQNKALKKIRLVLEDRYLAA